MTVAAAGIAGAGVSRGFQACSVEGRGKDASATRAPGPPHSDDMASFVISDETKIVNFHRLMTRACKPLCNQVYSRLLGNRNDCDEKSQPDVLLEGSRRPAQTQQWHAA
jgi:hypothetical protein